MCEVPTYYTRYLLYTLEAVCEVRVQLYLLFGMPTRLDDLVKVCALGTYLFEHIVDDLVTKQLHLLHHRAFSSEVTPTCNPEVWLIQGHLLIN